VTDPLDPETGKLIEEAWDRICAWQEGKTQEGWRAILTDLCREVRKGAENVLDDGTPTPYERLEREVSDLRERLETAERALANMPCGCNEEVCARCAALSSWDGPEIKEG
jgi:hypothetical protein